MLGNADDLSRLATGLQALKREALGTADVEVKSNWLRIPKNRELTLADVAEYVEAFYNRPRRHSHLAGVSPEEFEGAHIQRQRGVH